MQTQELTQSQKIQSFKLATKIVIDIAEEIKSKSELEQKQIVNKTIGLLRELYPALTPTSGYVRTYTGSKNQNDSYKMNEEDLEKLRDSIYVNCLDSGFNIEPSELKTKQAIDFLIAFNER